MKKLTLSLIMVLCALGSYAQFGTITFNQDTVVVIRRLKVMTLRPGLTTDSIIVHKANGNIGALGMNQFVVPWANVSSKPTFATVATSGDYNDLINKPTVPAVLNLVGTNGVSVSGSYPNLTVSHTKRQETYSGTTNASGLYTVTYGTAYSVAPNIQFQIGTGGNNKETILLTSSTTTGFTVYVQLRADVLGLLPSYSNVSGRNVDILVTEK